MLTYTVVRALANLMVSIDLSDEEYIDVQFASDLLNDTSGVLGDLSPEEAAEFVTLIRRAAAQETHPDRREALELLPETLGHQ